MDILLAQPRGFCAGVVRAVGIVEQALALHGAPVYVFHEIVHNRHVVDDLKSRGVVFVDDLDAVPPGAVTVFSAHGVSDAVVSQARARRLRVVDATCPLVAKVHLQAQRYARLGCDVIVVGHRGHEEVEGTIGSVRGPVHLVSGVDDVAALEVGDPSRVAYVTQTTLSLDDTRAIIQALQARFPAIQGPGVDDICYATQNRQNAVRDMLPQVDLVLVVGARNSSNSNRLRELASERGVPAYLVEDARDIDPAWLAGVRSLGLTSGASAPEVLVTQVCERLRALGAQSIRQLPGLEERVSFRLPPMPAPRRDDRAFHEAVSRGASTAERPAVAANAAR
ncbi:MAG: 4-hydroxy-3-methylbut-2-enyl diphosphate reductase [Steroidobacteraceae bacterium]|jgi:4-hydroxy-3-methylbut-2-enyl diphosphate reductase|nr:4-hydroxy-3-methylbut-2-enyl diphosphate reductase [Steroidobacteraceae bacterium]